MHVSQRNSKTNTESVRLLCGGKLHKTPHVLGHS